MNGVVGMLFAVPVCSVLYALGRLQVRQRLGEKGLLNACEGAAQHTEEGGMPPSEPCANNDNVFIQLIPLLFSCSSAILRVICP